MNPRDHFLTACRGGAVDRPPAWIMRQAGRILPEYRALREKHSFWDVCRNPGLAAEVTLQPMRRFPLDAAIIFSDILVVPAAMGMSVDIYPRMVLKPVMQNLACIEGLGRPDVSTSLGYVAEALRRVRTELGMDRALLGFAGAPFTLACYMAEGGGAKHFAAIKSLLFREPLLLEELLRKLEETVGDFLELQLEAGADAVQIFDSWAGELAPSDYRQRVLPHVRRLVERIQKTGHPVIYYINGAGTLLEAARETGADVLGIDWRVEMADAVRRLGPDRPSLQGNLDPCALFAPPRDIRERVHTLLEATGGQGHVLNLGHGVHPETPLEGVEAFLLAAESWGKEQARS